ncbi:MAG: hypothetical protein F6K11_01045 [Leptolyngbya sp. SIO3F4]|nr:hypothetical protein [Leptolyngbya sp. SIO3F4]
MENRDAYMERMRPSHRDEDRFETEEVFEKHSVLPILKFQSTLLFSQFRNYLKDRKPAFNAFNQKTQKRVIREVIRSDRNVQRSLINTITSLFTMEEFSYYQQRQVALNRRITQRITERFQENIERLL